MKIEIGPYVNEGETRKVDIHIDNYDIWNLDHTLALIIVPCLKKYRENAHGYFAVDNEDTPEHLYTDDSWSKERMEFVLDEMIFAFETVVNDDRPFLEEDISERTKNGLRLFGKYFQSLWD